MFKFFLIFSLFSAITGCASNERVENGVYYSHSDFNTPIPVKGSVVHLPLRGKPMEYTILRDSIVLINYWENEDCLIDVVNMNSGKLLRKIGKKGSGEDGLLSASLKYKSPSDNYFLLRDVTKNLLIRFNIDSLLNTESYTGTSFDLPSFAGDATFFNEDSILYFNSYFLTIGDSVLNSNSNTPVGFINLSTGNLKSTIVDLEKNKQPKYFSPNVSGGNFLINYKSKNIWLIDNYHDKITIYDNNLNIQKHLIGPEEVNIKYELRPDSAIYFKDGKYYRSFYPGINSENHVYVIYLGIKGIDLDHQSIERPVTILKFDWNGKPISEYKLDKFLYNISLSRDEKILYGTSAEKFGDTARLIRYNF